MSLRKDELIGLRVRVVRATDPGLVGVEGRVVDETRNLLVVEAEGREKRIAKQGTRFRFDVRGSVDIEGDDIRFRPEDRIKKAR
ncbi:MAG TPA: ribonuclease P protein subunit [Thermoplasmata archaeon]|nr:ribonuclease P protein subunit [Thermoplasmata archaeon]